MDCIVAGFLDPLAANPVTPLQSPTSPAGSQILFPKMSPVDRCSVCHRYKKNAPNPELNHAGSKGESKCKLDHFPSPCDFTDEDGNPCAFVESENTNTDEIDVNTQVQNTLAVQALEMSSLKTDLAEIKRMIMSNRTPPSTGASLAVTTTTPSCHTSTTTTSSITTPQMSNTIQSGAGSAAGLGLQSAAQDLLLQNEDLQTKKSNLGGYSGPSMKDLQKDQSIADEVQKQMNLLISGNPSLQKVVAGASAPKPTHGQGRTSQNFLFPNSGPDTTHLAYQAIQDGHSGEAAGPGDCGALGGGAAQRGHPPNLLDMDSLLGMTVREKQYRPHEFAARGNFYYAKNINERNITLPLYVFGYLKHCVILQSGLVPVAEGELMARLVNLMNICEIASNNSTLNDFDHVAWQMARAYGDRVMNDIEHGLRSWPELPAHVLPDVFLHARDSVDNQIKKKQGGGGGGDRGRGRGKGGRGTGRPNTRSGSEGEKLVCTSYNDFYTGNGCAYEYSNNKKCSYEHYCSKCFAANGTKEAHKGRFCNGATPSTTPSSG